MSNSPRLLIALLAMFAVLAAACGGDDDSADASPEPTLEAADEPIAEPGDGEPDPEPEPDAQPAAADPMEPVRGGTLTYGIISDGTGFDTLSGVGEGAIRIISALTDTLVVIDENFDWQPWLAESLTPNEDASVWTIRLRDGVTFHDGVTFDAQALKANWEAIKASPTVSFALGPLVEINIVDPLTVKAVMNQPWGAFPYALLGTPGWMLSPDTIGQNDTFVSTGPFTLESWTPGDGAVTVRNPNYWANPELPYLDSVVFKVIPEQNARRAALEAGDIQAYCCPGDQTILDFQDDDAFDVYVNDGASNEILVILNTTTAPTDDLRIRRAMAHALDQQLLIDTFRSGLTTPAKSFISPTSRWWVDTDYPQYDPEQAAALVAEYEAEVGPAELTFNVSNLPSALDDAALIASFWEDAGIEVTINEVQPGTEVPIVISDAFQAQYWAQFSAYDPDGSYVFFHSNGGLINWSNLSDPALDEGFDIARESLDPAVRAQGYAQVQQALADQVPMIWIDHLSGVEGVAAHPSVHGIVGRELPDGTRLVDFLGGSFFGFGEVWIG